jgi:hypothetical protein
MAACAKHTLDLCYIHPELVALFQKPSSPFLDEVVEARGELIHATAQVVKAEVDGGELVGHGRRVVHVHGAAHAGAEGWFEGCHDWRWMQQYIGVWEDK